MSAPPPVSPCRPSTSGRPVRIEYLDFQNVAEHREYRLVVCWPEGRAEFRFRIALAAFSAGRVRLQDGPDVCYQKLLRAVGGETTGSDVITIDDVELASYRETHTPAPKHRSSTPSSPTKPPFVPRTQPQPPSPRQAVPALGTSQIEPALGEGQRVSHEVFGIGVTISSSGGHTIIRFDEGGARTFVTSLLQVEVLSAPHTWEASPRGKNRPRESSPVAR